MLVTINLSFRIITQLDCIYVDYKYLSMSTCSHANARASKLRQATSIRHVSIRQDHSTATDIRNCRYEYPKWRERRRIS